MTFVEIFTLVAIIILAVFLPFCITMGILDYKKNKDKCVKLSLEAEEEIFNKEPEVSVLHAEVVDMFCGVECIGHRLPKTIRYFTVVFKSDDGAVLSLPVLEEMYHGFEVGLVGTLKLINGGLDSFVLDEQ